jgi:leader peptidase (prepilin peptidase)/N-methyltransferase
VYLRKRLLRATALLPFGLFLAPAIWLGWLAEAQLN